MKAWIFHKPKHVSVDIVPMKKKSIQQVWLFLGYADSVPGFDGSALDICMIHPYK